ncbi:MAG: type I polyketide synthase [Qingshengfaniella sp.]
MSGIELNDTDIAIVGMAAHLPDAPDISAFWANLRDGVESIRRISSEDLARAGETPDRLHHKDYVPAAVVLDGFDAFDADFFGLSPKEAAIMDPQHRQFLECAWEALENAGHPPQKFAGPIGVFAGCGMGSYFYFNVCSNPDLVDGVGMFLLRHTGNDKDFLSTRVSYTFDLKGPSVNVQTACSTSLVALHYGCQALLKGECDMALAGGVTIELPHGRGYIYKDGEILSPDGHCHAFDHRAEGTIFGSGAGAVVLRRLKDAIADGDHIWAVVKGTAINNDGASKAGYLAPSVDGQATAIAAAHRAAGISAASIDYVECHGTGTYLGDPIEVAALTEAFRQTTEDTGFCRIGSVKTNIGHLDTAAGVASVIKTALALTHRQIPPSLGYEAPNPAIDFDSGPFQVNAALTPWIARSGPRRAGVNSLGVGGTNAHAVLEEAPAPVPSEESDWPFQLLTLSARNKAALDAAAAQLATHLRTHPDQPLADIAYTLKEGRHEFGLRRVVVAETHEEAADLLERNDPYRVFTHAVQGDAPGVVFMFPGGGAQYAGMARDLYDTEPTFREWMDRGLDLLSPRLDYDIRALWLPEPGQEAAADAALTRPSVQLPLIMIVEYALAQLWMSWGVRPSALIGHSMGENTAACLAGVLSFEDCIGLVHLRGTLFDEVASGGMLSVPLSREAVAPYLDAELDIAAVNAGDLTVVSGPAAALRALEARLLADEITAQRIPIDIAAHSRMLDPILTRFGDYLRGIRLHPPRIPIVSNRTGQILTDADATDPDYWVGHLRNTVLFAEGISTLAETKGRVFLEVGPGRALTSLAQANGGVAADQVIGTLRHPRHEIADDAYFLTVIGRLWAAGVQVDWDQIWGEAKRLRVPLPTYPFRRSPYFIEPGKSVATAASSRLMRSEDMGSWGWRPAWRQSIPDCIADLESVGLDGADPETWLFFADDAGLATWLITRLRAAGHRAIEVRPGDAFHRSGPDSYLVSPESSRADYQELIDTLVADGVTVTRVVHLWGVTRDESFRPGSSFFNRTQEQGFYSLLFLAQAIGGADLARPLDLLVISNGALQVRDEPVPYPEKATLLGPVQVIPREFDGLTCRMVDIDLPESVGRGMLGRAKVPNAALEACAGRLLEELLATPRFEISAWRRGRRFTREMRRVLLPAPADVAGLPLREGGTYLITGGFGGIGMTIAEMLWRQVKARLVLFARSPLPARGDWADHLRRNGPQDPVSRRIAAVTHLEALGAEVLVLAGDVCIRDDVLAAVEATHTRFGRIDGVIHAAGAVHDGLIMTKTMPAVEDVFSPKIQGTRVLAEVIPPADLDFLVLFSSSSTVTAPAGQVDYVAANAFLNAFAQARTARGERVLAINWGIWRDVGMAAEALAERTGQVPDIPVTSADVPLLSDASFDRAGNRVFTARYTARAFWVLDEHRTIGGDALLPGTGYLELAAEALAAHGEVGSFEIRDLYFLRPLTVDDMAPCDMRVRLRRDTAGYVFEVQSACTVDGRAAWARNAEASLVLDPPPVPPALDLGEIAGRCPRVVRATENVPLVSAQEAHLAFGPRWRVLSSTAFGKDEGLAELQLPAPFISDLAAGYLLHPALLDLATGWAMDLIPGYDPGTLWVPLSYGCVRVHAALPARLFSHVRVSGPSGDGDSFARFDVTLTDASGAIFVEIRDFTVHRLADARFTRPQPPRAADVEFDDSSGDATAPLSPSEERLQHNLSQGIRAAEGGEAFLRALATGLPQVVVSSLDLPGLIAQTAEDPQDAAGQGQKFDRPELDSAYVAPTTDVERQLVAFWEELLGVDQVGIEDSFFDLGGHSLIAVRLFTMIKKAYKIEFPISVLFEAPTIAKCAALIAARTGISGGAASAEGTASQPGPAPRRFRHLVPMHQGEGGSKPPFFMAAGMFGNVLNLRYLAYLVGTDRPFYGLQARGLLDGDDPHPDFPSTAADYIREMRAVQPEGPYYIGGYSGGGITAYEIARQLEAAGETVGLLVMLDTPLPQRPLLHRVDKALMKFQDIRSGGLAYFATWARNRWAWEVAKLRRRFGQVEPEPETQFQNRAIEAAFYASLTKYDLQPWDGPVVLYRPPLDRHYKVAGGREISLAREYVYPDNDWTRWIPGLDVIEVPGDHDSMVLEPNVRVLATRMRRALAAAEGAVGHGRGPATAQAAE